MKKVLVLFAVVLFSFFLSLPEAAEESANPVVLLEGDAGLGSGVVIGQRQTAVGCQLTVVTAKHVVTVSGLKLEGTTPYVIISHPVADIAVAMFSVSRPCSEKPYGAVELDAAPIQPLEDLVHVGFPRGQYIVGHTSYVGSIVIEGELLSAISSVGGPGSSGGAIFREGRLVGLLVRGEMAPPFRNYFVPISNVFDIVPVGV